MDINRNVDIHNSYYGYQKYRIFDTYEKKLWTSVNRIVDIHKSDYGYPETILFGHSSFDYRISIIRNFDILISNNRYKNRLYLWISLNRIMDIEIFLFL